MDMLNLFIRSFAKLDRREKGQALAEYSLVLAFVALACIIALGAIGLAVSGQLSEFAGFLGGS